MVCFTYRRITGSIRRKSLDAGRMYALRDRKQPRSQETAIHQCQLPPGLHLGRGPNDAVGQRQRRRFVEFRPFAGPCDQYLCLECQFQQLVRSRRFDRSIRRIHRDQQSSIDQGRPPAGRGRAAKGFRRHIAQRHGELFSGGLLRRRRPHVRGAIGGKAPETAPDRGTGGFGTEEPGGRGAGGGRGGDQRRRTDQWPE